MTLVGKAGVFFDGGSSNFSRLIVKQQKQWGQKQRFENVCWGTKHKGSGCRFHSVIKCSKMSLLSGSSQVDDFRWSLPRYFVDCGCLADTHTRFLLHGGKHSTAMTEFWCVFFVFVFFFYAGLEETTSLLLETTVLLSPGEILL